MRTSYFAYAAVFIALFVPTLAAAEDKADDGLPSFSLALQNKEFSPFELVVPAEKKIKIIVRNNDLSPMEFESAQLNREKIVQPDGEVTVFLGPLKPGTYKYFDDFNRDAKGFITAK